MRPRRTVVIGAGMGGLAAALDLAVRGVGVTLIEAAAAPGGKMRTVLAAGRPIDAGPTVFTMRWVFDELFMAAGTALEHELALTPATILARHAWRGGATLDLHSDLEASVAAIRDFAGPTDAEGYRRFCARSREVYETLLDPFMRAERPSPFGLVRAVGLGRLGALWRTAPFATLAGALAGHFTDPRLVQLFGRYSTYVGSSPFLAPATLMLIAHVEQAGVWRVEGGMRRVADALARVATRRGATIRYGTTATAIDVAGGRVAGVRLADGHYLPAEAVVFAGDCAALGAGLLGEAVRHAVPLTPPAARSLSALTWCLYGRTRGFPLSHHNVFFSDDYRSEFADLIRHRRVPADPTVYVCAQDRDVRETVASDAPERLLVLINAPPSGDGPPPDSEAAFARARAVVGDCGLELEPEAMSATGPGGFAALFPGSAGALYGRANHGPFASFDRPGTTTAVGGLYLAGGTVHPGAGVPMAALSGRLAAGRVASDLGLPPPARRD